MCMSWRAGWCGVGASFLASSFPVSSILLSPLLFSILLLCIRILLDIVVVFLPQGTFTGGADTVVVQAPVVEDFLVVRVTMPLAGLGQSVVVLLSLLVLGCPSLFPN